MKRILLFVFLTVGVVACARMEEPEQTEVAISRIQITIDSHLDAALHSEVGSEEFHYNVRQACQLFRLSGIYDPPLKAMCDAYDEGANSG